MIPPPPTTPTKHRTQRAISPTKRILQSLSPTKLKRSFEATRLKASSTPFSNNNTVTPGSSTSSQDLAIAIDGSFVETTSEPAAKALAKYYAGQEGKEFTVSSRRELGQVIYRIRPSSDPVVARLSFESERVEPVASTSQLPPPSFTFQAATPQKPERSRPASPPASPSSHRQPARISRSVPYIHSPDTSAFPHYPAPSATTISPQAGPLRRVGSTPAFAPEIRQQLPAWKARSPLRGVGTRGDVLRTLLGWNDNPQDDLPDDLIERFETGGASLDEDATATIPFPAVDRLQPSPFGTDVRLVLSRSRTVSTPERSTRTSLESEGHLPVKSRLRRETTSTETIKTSTRELPPRINVLLAAGASSATLPRFQDPSVFDIFQSSPASPIVPSSPSFSSFASSATDLMYGPGESGSGSGQEIIVSTLPGDDARFIIWGTASRMREEHLPHILRPSPATSVASASPVLDVFPVAAGGGGRRPSMVSVGQAGIELPRVEEDTSDQGSPVTQAGSSARWSHKDRRSIMSGTGGGDKTSPATSVRESFSSSAVGGRAREDKRVLMAATVERLVAELTSRIEPELLTGFFLTYRSFVRPVDLCQLLITRFTWAMLPTRSPEDDAGRRIVRVRTFVVLRHWLLNHFADDFIPDKLLRKTLTDWLNMCGKMEAFRSSPKDQRLIKGLKKLVRRLKEMYVQLEHDKLDHLHPGHEGQPSQDLGSDDELDFDLEPKSTSPASTSTLLPAVNIGHTIDSTPVFALTSTFPLPNEQHPIARSFTSALGSLGRFKRMLNNSVATHPPLRHFSSIEAFDELEFEPGTAKADILYVKGGVERYLAYLRIVPDAEEEPPFVATMSLRDEDVAEEPLAEAREERAAAVDAAVVGLGITDEEPSTTVDADTSASLHSTQSSFRKLKHSKSIRTLRSVLSRFSLSTPSNPNVGTYDYMDQATTLGFFQRPPSARIELDDIDLSDEDDDVVEIKRTLKRLPAAQNLRTAWATNNVFRLPAVQRRSIDTVSSYGSPRQSEFQPHSFLDPQIPAVPVGHGEGENRLREGTQRVENFILAGMESDDEDEPGDVEAALRRLEGQIDEGKQKERMKKVDAQMDKSLQLERFRLLLQASGQELPVDNFRQIEVESVMDDSMHSSIAPSLAEELPTPDTITEAQAVNDTPSLAPLPVADADAPVTLVAIDKVTAPLRLPQPQRTTLLKKSSIRDFFHMSSAPRPVSTRPTTPTHRSFILLCRTEVLARQFCLIERDLLRVVSWQELVAGVWREKMQTSDVMDWEKYLKDRRAEDIEAKARGDRRHLDVQAVVARFNLMTNWVSSEILLTVQLEERVALIAKFIRLAFKCYRQSNFQTLTQIIHGLQSPAVSRLKRTWARVAKWEMREFKGLKAFVSHLNDFKYLRHVSNALIAEYGPAGQSREVIARPSTSSKSSSHLGGCIPFFGLFLQDLTLHDELPTFLDPTSPDTPAHVDNLGSLEHVVDPDAFSELPMLPSGVTLRPLVNVHKFKMISSIVQRVLAFQEFAQVYPFEPESATYFKCLKIRCLDMTTLQELSLRMEA